MSKVTIVDIARICGVGITTVSRAINNHPDINPDTKAMIMQCIKENNYVPNNSARNLKRSDSKAIAVLIKGINNPFFSTMIQVIENEVRNQRYSFHLQRVDPNQDEVEVAIELVKEKRLKGIIFLGGFFKHTKEALEQLTVPFILSTVSMTEDIERTLYSSVAIDDLKESYRMISYLIDIGHRKIAILAASADDRSIGRLRLEGYKKALKDHGLPYDERLVIHMKPTIEDYSMANGYATTKELLESELDFTAIFALSDSMAIGACKALFDAGKHVPEDYSVAGFDGLEISHYYNPSITTIRQPVEEIASETIKVLFELINKQQTQTHKTFPAELVIGRSTLPHHATSSSTTLNEKAK